MRRVARLPILTVSIATAALLVSLSPQLVAPLQFDRQLIIAGEWWRLFTCYLTHWNSDHLFWDLTAFTVLGYALERSAAWSLKLSRVKLIWIYLSTALAASLAVLFLNPEITQYRGLSAICVAQFGLTAGGMLWDALLREDRLFVAATTSALVLLAAKVLYETISGNTIFVEASQTDFVVLSLTHFAGAGIALVVSLSIFVQRNTGFSLSAMSRSTGL